MTTHNLATQQPTTEQLTGWLSTFYINRGGTRLGPYYVRRWKANGKLHREYVKPADFEETRAACQANRDRRKQQIEVNKSCHVFRRNWDFVNRIFTRAEKGQGITLVDAAHILRIKTEGWRAPGRPPLRRKREPFQILNRRTDFLFHPNTAAELLALLEGKLPPSISRTLRTANRQLPTANTPPFMVPRFTNRKKHRITNHFQPYRRKLSIEEIWIRQLKRGIRQNPRLSAARKKLKRPNVDEICRQEFARAQK